jgi:hypothetical protein
MEAAPAAPDLEVVCVTGLPARTENVRAVFFCLRDEQRPDHPLSGKLAHNSPNRPPFYNDIERALMINSGKRRWAFGMAVFALTVASYAQWSNPADDVPAYHPSAPLKVSGLPPILAGPRLTSDNFRYPWQVHVYQQAAKVGNVLYQLPCNCRCDRALGHTSLRSCFEGYHGTECDTCAKEAFFAYQQTHLGKTPAQIRAAIARHEYEAIDLERQ